MARRKLGLSVREWDALTWWEQRVYLDGWENENAERDEQGNRLDGEGDSETQQGSGEDAVTALFG